MLLIIDMQKRYVSMNYPEYVNCIQETIHQIKLAKRRGEHILIVEFDEDQRRKKITGSTTSKRWPGLESISSLVKNYNNKTYIFKADQDGGKEVAYVLKKMKTTPNKIRVCGVYASYCVKETVHTLASILKNTNINLVWEAIACFEGNDFNKIQTFKELCGFQNVSTI